MKQKISIHWFKQDFRLQDNPSINYLSEKEEKTLFIYILDNNDALSLGSASKVWLHHSLEYLNKQLNGKLLIFNDSAINVFKKLIQDFIISSVSWNRCYDQESIKNDSKIKIFLKKHIDDVKSFNGSLLWEPWKVLKGDGTPFKVFTPFYKNGCLAATPPRKPLTKKIKIFDSKYSTNNINFLKLIKKNKWASKITKEWKIGEEFAHEAMSNFFKFGITNYKEGKTFHQNKMFQNFLLLFIRDKSLQIYCGGNVMKIIKVAIMVILKLLKVNLVGESFHIIYYIIFRILQRKIYK